MLAGATKLRQGGSLDILSRRVVELVFPGPLEAGLDTAVPPQSLDGVANLRREDVTLDLCRLHEDGLDVVLHPRVRQWQLERLHGLENDAHRLYCVAEDDLLERFPLVARVTALVDELHLLQDGRLLGFTS